MNGTTPAQYWHKPTTEVILDSISEAGVRLTTFKLRYWRPVHSELMTHRVFSRCAGSSRARPSKTIIDQVIADPWGPHEWGANERGMQATGLIHPDLQKLADVDWYDAAVAAAYHAMKLHRNGLHKQIVNRVLEPYTFIDVVVSSVFWNNWWALRDHPKADPSLRPLAIGMKEAFNASTPKLLKPGEWHLPFIVSEDEFRIREHLAIAGDYKLGYLDVLKRVSAARCARTSYRAFDGKVAPISEELRLYNDLVTDDLVHASALEHQATPDSKQWIQSIAVASPEEYVKGDDNENVLDTSEQWVNPELHGNLTGWHQFRKAIPNEWIPG